MTHRITIQTSREVVTILFQGLLDRPAFLELDALCRAHRQSGNLVRVRLGAGTKVDTGLLDPLLRLQGTTIEAESPFLARWIQTGGKS
jgi:hypothetical protein